MSPNLALDTVAVIGLGYIGLPTAAVLAQAGKKVIGVDVKQQTPGVGGHCTAVDPWFLVSASREFSHLIRTAREVNDLKPDIVLNKALERADKFQSPVVAALGIAFKANIDDLRESPSKQIAVALADRLEGGTVLVVEPNVDTLPRELQARDNVELTTLDSAVDRADIVLLLVDHDPFKAFDLDKLAEKIVIDTKGLWR
jgi:UDP-N-acetyl-D-mannosaminuronic acid dehydrogenase